LRANVFNQAIRENLAMFASQQQKYSSLQS
jgi:hypothetical protein